MSAPLLEAAKHGRTAEIQRLLRLGASANQCDRETSGSALFWASCGGSYESVRLLLEAGCEVNASNVHGHSPLHAAADRGYTKVVEDLLESGAAVNARNSEGLTPLHLAAYRGYNTTVDMLLRSGADLRIRSNDNKTAVHEALAQKHFSVVEAMAHFEETTSSCKLDVIRRLDPVAGSYCRHQPQQSASASGPNGGSAFHKVKPQPLARDPVQLKKTVSSPPLQPPLREARVILSRGKVRADSLDSEGVTVPLQLLPGGQQLPSWCAADLAPLYPRQPASGAKAGWRSDDSDAAAPDRADGTTCQPLSPLHLDSWSDDRLALGNCDDEPSRWSPSSATRLDAPRHSCMGILAAAAPAIGRGKAVPAGADSSRSAHHVTVPQDSTALSDLEGSMTGHTSATTAAAHSSSQASATDPSATSVRAAVAAELCTCAPPAVSLACLACSASRLTDCKRPASSEHCWHEADVAGDRAPVLHAQAHSAVRHQQISRSLSMGSKPSCPDGFRQEQHLQQQQHNGSSAPPLLRHESDGSIEAAGQASRARQPPLPRPRCRRALAEASATAAGLPPVNRPRAPSAAASSSLSAVEAEQPAAAEDAAVGSTDVHAAMPSWLPGVHYVLVDGEPFSFVRQRGGSRRLLFRIASMLSVAYTLKVVLNADCDQLPLNLRMLNPAARVALMSSDLTALDQLPPVPAHRHVARILASYFGDGSYFTCIGVPSDAVPSVEQQGSGGGAAHVGGARRSLRTHAAIDARLSMRTTQGLAAQWQSAGHAVAAMFYVMPGSYVHTLGSFMRCHRAIWPVPPYGIEAGTYLRLAYEMLCAAVHLRQAANLCHCAVTPEAVYLTADVRVAVGDMEACAPLLAVDGSCIAYSEESLMQSSCSRNVDYEWWPPELERHILLLGLGRPPEHPIYAHVLHEKSDSYSIGRTMYAVMAAQGRGGKGRNSPPTLFPVISRAKLYYRDDEVPDVTDGCSSDCYPSSLRALLCSLVCDASSRPTAAEALLRIEKELELPASV